MTDSMRFPKNPLTGFENRFEDDQGNNPYADPGAPPAAADDNIFAAPGHEDEPIYQPVYDAILTHRAPKILRLAILGFVFAIALAGATLFARSALTLSICNTLLNACNVALAVTALLMARDDFKAMKAGAMHADGKRKTMVALVLASVGSSISGGFAILNGYITYTLILQLIRYAGSF